MSQHKLTVEIPDQLMERLRILKDRDGSTIRHQIIRAISNYLAARKADTACSKS